MFTFVKGFGFYKWTNSSFPCRKLLWPLKRYQVLPHWHVIRGELHIRLGRLHPSAHKFQGRAARSLWPTRDTGQLTSIAWKTLKPFLNCLNYSLHYFHFYGCIHFYAYNYYINTHLTDGYNFYIRGPKTCQKPRTDRLFIPPSTACDCALFAWITWWRQLFCSSPLFCSVIQYQLLEHQISSDFLKRPGHR